MRRGLELDNGEKGAPNSDHDRLVWGRTLDRAGAIERHDEALLDRSMREVERYRLILAGKVTDFRLASERPAPAPKAAEKVTGGMAGYLPQESAVAVDDVVALPYTSTNPADATPPARWGEEATDPTQDPPALTEAEEDVLAVLDKLEVPTEWGRPRVREALADRVPEIKIGDAPLGRVILYRKLQPQD